MHFDKLSNENNSEGLVGVQLKTEFGTLAQLVRAPRS